MSWWKFSLILTLAVALGALGCGSSASSTVTIAISPTISSVITNRTQLFSGVVTGNSNTAISWTLACATGATACGMIDATGLYTAPATIPTTTSNGTTTIAPTVTITGTAKADTSKTATATLTIVTGISISIANPSATVGTGETFSFNATVNNPGCNLTSTPTCEDVTWALSTTLTGIGTIVSSPCNTQPNGLRVCIGVYKAPTTVPTPSTVFITATSVADTSVTATATALIVTAALPTVSRVSPTATALGGLFQDIYITGTNFISTNTVYINGSQLDPSLVTGVDTGTIRARIPDYILAIPPPSGFLQVGVSEQTGTVQTCASADASMCQITVAGVRPGVVGPVPDSIAQGTAGVQSFMVDGGFFGTGSNPAAPAVSATFNGQLRGIQLPASQTIGSTRQLSVTIGGGSNSSDFTVPGLYPVAIKSTTDPTKFAVTNLAVQPNYNNGSTITTIKDLTSTDGIGTSPSDVAIDPGLGMAVVANTGSNDVNLIDLTAKPPSVVATICTADKTSVPPSCTSSGPTSVAVDYVRHIALVVNSASKTVAIVDLLGKAIQTVLPVLQDTPGAVGINPVTGHALVAMQQKNYGVLVDVTNNNPNHAPAYFGIVSISTGSNTKVAVEPHLNWALATPGTLGSLGIVDLNQQSTNAIAAVSRTSGTVTVTVQSTGSAPPLSITAGDAVYVQNVQIDPTQLPSGVPQSVVAQSSSFNGFYAVSSVGPGPNQFSYSQPNGTFTDVSTQSIPVPTSQGTINYAQPVATVGVPRTVQGIGINEETQQAVLADPTTNGSVSFFSLIDQSIVPISLQVNNAPDVGIIAAAYNPLTNTVVAVNFFTDKLSVIDPSGSPPRRLNDGNLFNTRPGPVAVAVDPGTNIAVVANQTDNSVSVLSLGPIQPFSITATSLKTFVSQSSLSNPATPAAQPITITGKGLICANGTTNLSVRLDGISIPTSCVGNGDRQLTATVGTGMLTSARRYALDVADSSGHVTNAEDFTVEQSVDVSSPLCPMPEPSGVAIDPQANFAFVTLFGCGSLAEYNMTTGSGLSTAVGLNPFGVAVLPRTQTAVVANNGAGNATIVTYANGGFNETQTITTGSGSMGAAADDATGEVAIANSLANTVTIVNVKNGGTSNISTGQRPIAVGFNYVNHQIAVAASSGNSLGISGGTSGGVSQSFNVSAPTSVIYDPVTTDCGSNNNGATTNTVGCFIVNSSTGNSVNVIDPITNIQTGFRMGINPTAIAYNYFTSTLVSTNTASHTVTVADFLGQKIRAVLPLPPASNPALALNLANAGALQYALAVHPLTNIAVIADTANGTVLFLPLPR